MHVLHIAEKYCMVLFAPAVQWAIVAAIVRVDVFSCSVRRRILDVSVL